MAPDNIPVAVLDFSRGVEIRNPSLVQDALKAGVQPDTAIRGRHPFWILLSSGYEDLPESLQTGMTRKEFSARTSQIVDELFKSGVKVAEEGAYATPTHPYLADRFLLSPDVDDAATITLHAIQETLHDKRPVYKPDFTRLTAALLASGAVPEDADYHAILDGMVDRVGSLHDAVRERLLKPQSQIEKEIAASGEVQYWISPMQRPDMARLLADMGLSSHSRRHSIAPGGQGPLTETFEAEAEPAAPFVVKLAKKSAKDVLTEMKDELVGLDALKNDAKRLAFRQNYNDARAAEQLPPTDAPELSTAYMGYDGVGKSSFVRKQAELLVALGLAGDNMVDINHDNMGKVIGGYPPKALARYFADADIIHIELSGGERDKEGKRIEDYILDALQVSLDDRKKPPVVFLTGWREDIDTALANNPPVRNMIKKFVNVEDPTLAQLGEALERRLAGPGGTEKPALLINKDAKDLVLREFAEARKRFGSKGFRNMREVDAVAENVPDAMAERIFGANESEPALSGDDRKKLLTTVTIEDIRALNLRKVLGGPALARKPGIGFHADL